MTAIGQTLAPIIPAGARPLHIDGFHRAMESGRTDAAGAPATVVATHADGSLARLGIAIGLLRDGAGEAGGAVATPRPAGERRPPATYAPKAANR